MAGGLSVRSLARRELVVDGRVEFGVVIDVDVLHRHHLVIGNVHWFLAVGAVTISSVSQGLVLVDE